MSSTDINRSLFDEVMIPTYNPQQFIPVTGKGSKVFDQEGKEYIDFSSGIAVNSLGHLHKDLVETLKKQCDKLWHVSNIYTNEPALLLAKKITEVTFGDKVFFGNSGLEANEAALKLARKYANDHYGNDKHQIISFKNSYHGRSLFTVAVGGQKNYSAGFEPLPSDIDHIDFNNLDKLQTIMSDKTCAVILEPIQGEGGVLPATIEFMSGIRQLCDKHHALMILDEVQTGMGRTGTLFSYMDYQVKPDILTVAKALGCGFPISATITTNKIAQSLGFALHGSTNGGNPLATSVALKALELINTQTFLDGVMTKHSLFIELLNKINQEIGAFKEIRGKGLLLGCELTKQCSSLLPSIITTAHEEGLMILRASTNIIRFAPALNIPDNDIEEGMKRFKVSLKKALAKRESS